MGHKSRIYARRQATLLKETCTEFQEMANGLGSWKDNIGTITPSTYSKALVELKQWMDK